MDRFQELMEKWEREANLAWDKYRDRVDREVNLARNDALYGCIDDLRDTLLLIEADQVARGGE